MAHPAQIRHGLLTFGEKGVRLSDVHAAQEKADSPSGWGRGSLTRLGRVAVDCHAIWLRCDEAELDARLDARVDGMVAAGLMDECRALLARMQAAQGLHGAAGSSASFAARSQGACAPNPLVEASAEGQFTRGIMQAIGFKELYPYVSAEGAPRDAAGAAGALAELQRQCVERLKTSTRQYARKQLQWLRNRFVGNGVPVTVLDATDASRWGELVSAPAARLAQRVLEDDTLPLPDPEFDALAGVRAEKERIRAQQDQLRARREQKERARKARRDRNLRAMAERGIAMPPGKRARGEE